jgi:hypothetical protein
MDMQIGVTDSFVALVVGIYLFSQVVMATAMLKCTVCRLHGAVVGVVDASVVVVDGEAAKVPCWKALDERRVCGGLMRSLSERQLD